MRVKLYIEGGGDSKSLHIKCREGFRKLFEKAGFSRKMPATKSCGSRNAAYDDFKTALRAAGADQFPILLVDSEGPVGHSAWQHLRLQDGWERPFGAEEDQAQLMVQCMETWCVADQATLRDFFGQHLHVTALPPVHRLEDRDKDDVQEALSRATRDCGKDRAYRKGKRSFELVGRLDPAELRRTLPHFAKLCEVLAAKL